jgi:hypothetical protein
MLDLSKILKSDVLSPIIIRSMKSAILTPRYFLKLKNLPFSPANIATQKFDLWIFGFFGWEVSLVLNLKMYPHHVCFLEEIVKSHFGVL